MVTQAQNPQVAITPARSILHTSQLRALSHSNPPKEFTCVLLICVLAVNLLFVGSRPLPEDEGSQEEVQSQSLSEDEQQPGN